MPTQTPINHTAEPVDRLITHYEVVCRYTGLMTALYRQHTIRTGLEHPHLKDQFFGLVHDGPASHWSEYRAHLLELHTKPFDYRRFVGAYDREIDPGFGSRNYDEFRIAGWVAAWMKHSRRVYSVPTDLQLLLAATTLKGVDWTTIRWPFKSFLVKLEQALEFGGRKYDAILVTEDPPLNNTNNFPMKRIVLIGSDLYNPKVVFDREKLEAIEKDTKRGRFEHASEKIRRIAVTRMNSEHHLRSVELPEDCFGLNLITEAALDDLEVSISRTVIRILFGLLFYLQSTPPSLAYPDGWEPSVSSRKDGAVRKITDVAEVCRIASVYTLTDQERAIFGQLLGGGTTDVTPHHREGHWRRPPGSGNDLTAKKTVWVRPTIVRRDKLADGGLPGGSEERL